MPLISVKPLKTTIIKPFESKKPLMRSLSSLRNKLSSTKLIPSKKSKETADVLKVLQPMHTLLWFFAPIPYDISKINGIFKATVIKNKVLYYLVYFVIGITTMVDAVLDQMPDNIRTSVTQINIAATNVLFIALYLQRKKTIKTLNKIAELDRHLIKLGYRIQYKFYVYLLWIIIVTEVALQCGAMKILNILNLPLSENLHHFIHVFSGLIISFYFCYIVICIMLTNNMLKNLNSFLLQTSNSKSAETRNTNLKTIRKIYSDFWHVTRCLNLNFNVIITIFCGICFINTITAVYIWWQKDSAISRAEMFQWIIMHLAKLIILSFVCNTAKEEGEKLSALLQNMYNNAFSESKHEISTIYQFLMQTTHEKIEYWACEMFPINKTFICSVVVAGTMNSILLLQLGLSKIPSQPQPFLHHHKI